MKKILNFVAVTSVAFFFSSALALILAKNVDGFLAITIFGGLLFANAMGAFDK